jgi:hypothetical protein
VVLLFLGAEVFALLVALTVLTTCAVVLLVRLGGTDSAATEPPPMPDATYEQKSGPSPSFIQHNDALRLNWYTTVESNRQRARAEQRAASYQSAAVAVGVAVAFIGLMLLLRTGRLWATAPPGTLGIWERVAHAAPGVLALVCAAAIIIGAREDRSGPDLKTAPIGVPYSYPAIG